MLDHSSKAGQRSGDPLTEMLRGLRLDGVDYARCQMAAPWGCSFRRSSAARFHFIARARLLACARRKRMGAAPAG